MEAAGCQGPADSPCRAGRLALQGGDLTELLAPCAQVHYGMVLPDGAVQLNHSDPYGLTVVPVHEDCGVWLHVVNLFVGRAPCYDAVHDTRWQWVLDTIQGLE